MSCNCTDVCNGGCKSHRIVHWTGFSQPGFIPINVETICSGCGYTKDKCICSDILDIQRELAEINNCIVEYRHIKGHHEFTLRNETDISRIIVCDTSQLKNILK